MQGACPSFVVALSVPLSATNGRFQEGESAGDDAAHGLKSMGVVTQDSAGSPHELDSAGASRLRVSGRLYCGEVPMKTIYGRLKLKAGVQAL
jgi:hypothetical protein